MGNNQAPLQCNQSWEVSGGGGRPGYGNGAVKYKKEDCGRPDCRDSGTYDGRHDKRDDKRPFRNILWFWH
jgi:hypothetical protein